MAASKKSSATPLWVVLIQWIGVPLALAAAGYYIVGPRLGAAPKSVLKQVSQEASDAPADDSVAPKLVRNNQTQALAAATAASPNQTLQRSLAATPPPTEVRSFQRHDPAPGTAAPSSAASSQAKTSDDGPDVTVSVRPVTHSAQSSAASATKPSAKPHRRRRHHHPVTAAKPPVTPAKDPVSSDDGSYGGTEEGGQKTGGN